MHWLRTARLGLVFLLALMAVPLLPARAAGTAVLYLLDDTGTGTSTIYQVALDSTSNRANLTRMPNGTVPYDSVALAATPDGSRLYVIGSGTMEAFGYYDVAAKTFTALSGVKHNGTPVNGIVQAAFSPDNTLYAVNGGNDDNMYRIDPATGAATLLGHVIAPPNGALAIDGADLAFAADGTLYLWTNQGNGTGNPRGLYQVTLPSVAGGQVTATPIGVGSHAGTASYVYGLAITANGSGSPIAFAAGTPGVLVGLDKVSGGATASYTLYRDGVSVAAQGGGDLSVGPLNGPPTVTAAFVSGTVGCGAGNATLSVSFADAGVGETHTATVDWGDGTTPEALGTVTSPFTAPHTYARAGSYHATVTVTDSGGASGTESVNAVRVDYGVVGGGIQPPIRQDGTSVFKYGSAVPVKIQVADCDGSFPSTLAPHLALTMRSGATPGLPINQPESTAAADTTGVMRFVAAEQHYIYNLATKPLPDPSATYEITITLPNGQIVTESFGLRI